MIIRLIMLMATTITVLLMCVGCSVAPALKPVSNPAKTWQHYQTQLNQLKQWRMTGLIGLSTPQKALSADITWSQCYTRYYIALSGPLGIGAVSITNQSGEATYTDMHAKQYIADSPEDLMQAQLGWSVPVSGLVYWLRGLPVANMPYQQQLNACGTLSELTQDQWHIHYQDYRLMDGVPIARRITMVRSDLRVAIVVNRFADQNNRSL